MGRIIPCIMGKKRFQTTNQMWIVSFPSRRFICRPGRFGLLRSAHGIRSEISHHLKPHRFPYLPEKLQGQMESKCHDHHKFSHQNCHKTAVNQILFFPAVCGHSCALAWYFTGDSWMIGPLRPIYHGEKKASLFVSPSWYVLTLFVVNN